MITINNDLAINIAIGKSRKDKTWKNINTTWSKFVNKVSKTQRTEETYQQYSKQHEQLQNEQPIPELDKEQEIELKTLYRKVCNFCHPDKVTEEKKDVAHEIFVSLQEAYKNNDIGQVTKIYERVKNGDFSQTRATTLSKVEILKAAIAEIKYQIDKLLIGLQQLQASQAVQLMYVAGREEADWQNYFNRQYRLLVDELEKVQVQIQQFTDGVV